MFSDNGSTRKSVARCGTAFSSVAGIGGRSRGSEEKRGSRRAGEEEDTVHDIGMEG